MSNQEKAPKVSKAVLVLQTIKDQARLYPTPEGEVFARISRKGHADNLNVRSGAFKEWVSRQFYKSTGTTVGDRTIAEALNVLAGDARENAPEERVHLRVAEHGGSIYLNLANQDYTVIEIDAEGWREVTDPPVNFIKPNGMNALPMPETGGTLALFKKYFNLSDADLKLAIAWMVAALRPKGPYPVLNLNGEQGSGKSNMTRFFKEMVDPTESEDRAEPRVPRDMMIAASNEHVLAYDNVSHLTPSVSDTICRIATGASSTVRALYTDKDESIIKAQRPQIINAIEGVAIRPDLVERSIFLTALHISEDKRRPEDELWADFEQDKGKMLGYLLTSVSTALRNLPHVKFDRLPRMADFIKWSVAAEPAWGVTEGSFLTAYYGNQSEAQDSLGDASSVVQAVLSMVGHTGCFSGQPQTLLRELAKWAGAEIVAGQPVFFNRPSDWPRDERGLTGALTRLAPLLRKHGIEYARRRSNGLRLVELCGPDETTRVDSAA